MNALTMFDHVQGVAKCHLPAGDATQWELMLAEMKMNEKKTTNKNRTFKLQQVWVSFES